MRVTIEHVTRYTYDGPVQYSIQTLKVTPPNFDGQRVLEWRITAPGIDEALTYRDGLGNLAHLVTFFEPHEECVITARGIVETEDRAGIVRGLDELAPVHVFLRQTRKTQESPLIQEFARQTCKSSSIDDFHSLMNAVRDKIDYQIGATTEHTTAEAALADGRGVCQDHAHVFIAAARSLGAPARYINGYLVSDAGGPSEAHHAWAEVWIEGLGWVGFDPANRVCPTDRYVRLATGFDAESAAPIRGTRSGGVSEGLSVTVEVQQQHAQQ